MENKPAQTSAQNKTERPKSLSRRELLQKFLAVGAVAAGMGSVQSALAEPNPLRPQIDVMQNSKPELTDVNGEERLAKIDRLSRVLNDFLNPQAINEVKGLDYFDDKSMKVRRAQQGDASIYYFYGKRGEKDIKFATFVDGKEGRAWEVNVLTDISGPENLEQLAGKAGSMLRNKVDFTRGGFVATEDIDAAEGEVNETIIMHADFPESRVVQRDPDTNKPIRKTNRVMVHPAGFIRLMQEESSVLRNAEDIPL